MSVAIPNSKQVSAPGTEPLAQWSLVVSANNDRVLRNTLLASPAIDARCQVIVERSYASAGAAYNAGLDKVRGDIAVFAHQDVYLPAAWISSLSRSIEQLRMWHVKWAILGAFGVTRDAPPVLRGHCYSTGLGQILGKPFSAPIPARTLDELVLIVRRSSGVRFDEQLPGFHLYGADICLSAEAQGMGSFIVPAFCIHNSNGIRRLPKEFWRAYFYLRRKWRADLPISTCCTTITRECLPMAQRIATEWKNAIVRRPVGTRCQDAASLYTQLCADHPEIAPGPTDNNSQRGPLTRSER